MSKIIIIPKSFCWNVSLMFVFATVSSTVLYSCRFTALNNLWWGMEQVAWFWICKFDY